MSKFMSPDRWLGLIFIVFSLLLIFVWIPLDVETGYLEKVRRAVVLGDSLGPALAGGIMLLGGLLLLLKPDHNAAPLDRKNMRWLLLLLLSVVISVVIMRYAGSLVSWLAGAGEYRVLRDTLPWKYIGFLLGGGFLVFTLMTLAAGRFSWLQLLIAIITTLLIAMFYDLPFDNLLLPPNGDV